MGKVYAKACILSDPLQMFHKEVKAPIYSNYVLNSIRVSHKLALHGSVFYTTSLRSKTSQSILCNSQNLKIFLLNYIFIT